MGYRAGIREGRFAWRCARGWCVVGALGVLAGCSGSSVSTNAAGAGASADLGAGAGGSSGASGGSGGALSCPAFPRCGGDPIGTWVVASVCALPAASPARSCTGLDYEPASAGSPGIANVQLPLPQDNGLDTGSLTLNADHTYSFMETTRGSAQLLFTPACLTAHGANPTCSELTAQLAQLLAVVPSYSNMVCELAPGGGCDCSWNFGLAIGDQGSWQATGDALTLVSGVSSTTYSSDFCDEGDSLSLSVRAGSQFVGGATLGIRTLSMTRLQ